MPGPILFNISCNDFGTATINIIILYNPAWFSPTGLPLEYGPLYTLSSLFDNYSLMFYSQFPVFHLMKLNYFASKLFMIMIKRVMKLTPKMEVFPEVVLLVV